MPRGSLQLFLLRHADAGDAGAWSGPEADRPLSAAGRAQAERLGRFLAQTAFDPDLVLSSPKLRARQTAEIVCSAVGVSAESDDRLSGGFDLDALRELVDRAGDRRRLLLVGHDPDLSDLLADLCGSRAIPMRKCALARIDLDGPPARGSGTLRWLIPPDALEPRR